MLVDVGFIVVLTGNIMKMPWPLKVSSAIKIDVDSDGKITGIFLYISNNKKETA